VRTARRLVGKPLGAHFAHDTFVESWHRPTHLFRSPCVFDPLLIHLPFTALLQIMHWAASSSSREIRYFFFKVWSVTIFSGLAAPFPAILSRFFS
jgi:hypothetical protein